MYDDEERLEGPGRGGDQEEHEDNFSKEGKF